MDIEPRTATLVALLALVPIGVYAFGTPHFGGIETVLGLLNLGLIVGTLFLAFGPVPRGEHDGNGTTH